MNPFTNLRPLGLDHGSSVTFVSKESPLWKESTSELDKTEPEGGWRECGFPWLQSEGWKALLWKSIHSWETEVTLTDENISLTNQRIPDTKINLSFHLSYHIFLQWNETKSWPIMFLKNYWSIYEPNALIDCNNILLTLLIWSDRHAEKSHGEFHWENDSTVTGKRVYRHTLILSY